uniref:Putative ORF n=1 Tax=Homo sapiens TaxID=9606 RepID=E2QC07_HUMAN|nr:hypothetical protein - human [Homo sapiens]CAA61446.1 unnamed protein product [Homo sapiens]
MTHTLMMAQPPKKIDTYTMILCQGELVAFTECHLHVQTILSMKILVIQSNSRKKRSKDFSGQ